jgi:hypothetical protein
MLLTARAEETSGYIATVTFPCVGGPALFTTLLGSFINKWAWGTGVMGDRAPGRRVGFYRPSMPARRKINIPTVNLSGVKGGRNWNGRRVVTPYCCVAAAALRALIARKGTFMR